MMRMVKGFKHALPIPTSLCCIALQICVTADEEFEPSPSTAQQRFVAALQVCPRQPFTSQCNAYTV